MKLYDYAGVIHFHSEYSFDGRSSIPEILEAARGNGLDFLMLTDHHDLKARMEGFEGWHDNVLLIVGEEVNPDRFNHYLAFGHREPALMNGKDKSPQAIINRIRDLGGFGFIAHPDHEGTEMFHVKPFPWVRWEVSGYAGMGIWDFMTDWQSSLRGYFLALASYLFPDLFLQGPRQETLKRWDDLNKASRVVGIGELDNHNTLKRIFGLNLAIFPFPRAFRFIRTHILTEKPLRKEAAMDMNDLFSSLQCGRAYVAQESFCRAKGFSLVVSEGARKATMGDELFLQEKALMEVRLPCRGRIRVVRDGVRVHEAVSDAIDYSIQERGVYRVEIYLWAFGKYRPWIFSNPLYIR